MPKLWRLLVVCCCSWALLVAANADSSSQKSLPAQEDPCDWRVQGHCDDVTFIDGALLPDFWNVRTYPFPADGSIHSRSLILKLLPTAIGAWTHRYSASSPNRNEWRSSGAGRQGHGPETPLSGACDLLLHRVPRDLHRDHHRLRAVTTPAQRNATQRRPIAVFKNAYQLLT